MTIREIRHFHLFCGLGGGGAGFNDGHARVGQTEARFRCIGGVDTDPAGVADFTHATGVPATLLDLFDREQYIAWHGHEPPDGWRPAGPDDIRTAAHNLRPHIVFTSPPCKGFSGLLSQARSTGARYQALNALTLRGIWLTLEAWADDPPEFLLLENVPRIANRGRPLLEAIESLLHRYGYATAETTHDCGELGGLGQTRRRFLMVARHREKVPPFLYEPERRPLRSVGEVLEPFPLPGDVERAGPMHRLPRLQWRTWVRLALVEAGGDWRSLNRLRVEDGVLADYGIVPERDYFAGAFGVRHWDAPSGTVSGESLPANGAFSVADPRREAGASEYRQYGVKRWDEVAATVTGQRSPGQGPFSIADPRAGRDGPRFNNVYRVVAFGDTSPAVTAGGGPSAGGLAVSDPRAPTEWGSGKYRITGWDETSGCVIAAGTTGNGAFALADPRYARFGKHYGKMRVDAWGGSSHTVTGSDRVGSGALSIADPRCGMAADRAHYQTGGHYGVVPWADTAGVVSGSAKHDRGRFSVADPRELPAPTERGVYLIRSLDGTWHRPFTTLELAALQSLVEPGEYLELHGTSDSAWRERIGNAVPRRAAAAIASVMGQTLLLAWAGETFLLNNQPIWVRPLATAIAVDQPEVS